MIMGTVALAMTALGHRASVTSLVAFAAFSGCPDGYARAVGGRWPAFLPGSLSKFHGKLSPSPIFFSFRVLHGVPPTAGPPQLGVPRGCAVGAATDGSEHLSHMSLLGAWSLGFDVDDHHEDTMVTLRPGGTFASAAGALSPLEGQWSVDPATREVTVAIFGIAKTVKTWFVGTVDASGALVTGWVADGAIDSEWVGNFTLTKFMPSFEREARPEPAKPRKPPPPTFQHEDFYGPWQFRAMRYASDASSPPAAPAQLGRRSDARRGVGRLRQSARTAGTSSEGSSLVSPQLFELVLYSNSTWETTAGFGDGVLAGKWNVFEDDLDLGTGIKGSGSKLWLEARRFGTLGGQVSRGVAMTSDTLYIGTVSFSVANLEDHGSEEWHARSAIPKESRSPDNEQDDLMPRSCSPSAHISLRISGFIAHGYQNQPVFVGQFNMTRPLQRE